MANQEHLDILKQGVDVWNTWREDYPTIQPLLDGANLNGIDLSGMNLSGTHITNSYFGSTRFNNANLSRLVMHGSTLNNADLRDANMSEANFSGVNFTEANLSRANLTRTYLVKSIFRGANLCEANLNDALLSGAELYFANLGRATLINSRLSNAILTNAWLNSADLGGSFLVNALLREANLSNAYLKGVNFSDADLQAANLYNANLSRAILVRTNLTGANLTNCSVYGISCWDVVLDETKQLNLVITPPRQPSIAVDNLEVAQFIYLLLNNSKIRDVIDTVAKKAVLILGRFTPERKAIIDALREELRTQGYLPILFDFDKPASRDLTETVSTLAHLSRFVIADLTDAKSIPQELSMIVPNLPSVPVQPLILTSQHEYGMFEHFTRFPWVLPVYRYADEASLLEVLQDKVITPAELKAQELAKR